MLKRITTEDFISSAKSIHGGKYNYSKTKYVRSKSKVVIVCPIHKEFKQSPNAHLTGRGCKKCAMETLWSNQKTDPDNFINKLGEYPIKFSYKIIGRYVETRFKILVEKKFGECLVLTKDLLKGVNPSIKSAINKTEYFINQAKEVHKNTYDYSKVVYKESGIRLNIICKEHGSFFQKPHHHLSGHGCIECAYNISGWSDTNWKKAGERSKNFDSFKVYIIRCWNEEEEFYKIGKTFLKLKNRFRGQNITEVLPYNWSIMKVFNGNSREMSILERKLQKDNKDFVYLPKIKFNGQYECFKEVKYESTNSM